MLYLFCGPSGSGKSTAAKLVAQATGAEVVAGKDYLRLAKSDVEAWSLFKARLLEAASGARHLVYVMTETERFDEARSVGSPFVARFSARQDTLESRFAERTGGKLPPPVGKMLANQAGKWSAVPCDLLIDTSEREPESVAAEILSAAGVRQADSAG